jgi:hypothetical protein
MVIPGSVDELAKFRFSLIFIRLLDVNGCCQNHLDNLGRLGIGLMEVGDW